MTSYHDLEKQTYETIRAKPFTRIHGRPSWRTKERLIKDCRGPALSCKVNYDWSGSYGLLVEIIGAQRYAQDNPGLPAYVPPAQPSNSPTLPNNPTATQI